MSREIDWSQPLSDEDRAWAEQRDHLRSKIEANDEEFGGKDKAPEQTRAERMDELRSTINNSQNELARLEKEQADEDNANRALAGDPTTGNGFVDNTYVNGEIPDGATEAAEDYSDEKRWTKAALQAEIDKRNEEEGVDIPRTGTRSELVERLVADDRELAQQAQE